MARQNKTVFFRQYLNRRRAHDKALFKASYYVIHDIITGTIDALKAPSVKIIERLLKDKIKRPLVSAYREGTLLSLRDVESLYGKTLPVFKRDVQKQIDLDDLPGIGFPNAPWIVEQIGAKQVRTIAQNLHDKLANQIREGIENMESREQIRQRIETIQEQAPWMARRIAQTETTTAYNAGSVFGYEASGVVDKKEWSTYMMGNPRQWHIDADGQQVPVDQPFNVMGEELMYPGDPDGSPDNIINCKCGVMPVVA